MIWVEVEMFDGVSNIGHLVDREGGVILRPPIVGVCKRIIIHVREFSLNFLWSSRVKTNSFHLCSDKIFMISKSDKIFPDPAPYWMTHR